jgi:hypothetical protein
LNGHVLLKLHATPCSVFVEKLMQRVLRETELGRGIRQFQALFSLQAFVLLQCSVSERAVAQAQEGLRSAGVGRSGDGEKGCRR